MNKPQVRCAVYTRKSSEEGLEQSFNSLEAQREACVAYIQSQKHEGWIVIKDNYDDGGFSGGTTERPALIRLLSDIRSGKVETVIVYKVDRLTRSLSDFAKIIEVFDSHQVSFVSVTQQFNTTTSMGRLTLNVLLSFAQFERELTGERIRDKVAASKKKGMWMGGVAPLGYDCANHRLIINRLDAESVREIFQQYVRLGSITKLKEYLEQQKIHSKVRTSTSGRTSGGVVYSRGALHHLLSNRTYIGEIVHCSESYPGQHEPIIPRNLWDQVALLLKANNRGRRTNKARPQPSLLTGILRDTSGIRLTPTRAQTDGKRYRYYTSQAAIQRRADRPQITRYPAGELESLVTTEIHWLLGNLGQFLTENVPEAELSVERARTLAAKWPKTEVSKQQELIRAVVKAVTVGQKCLWIEVDRTKLMTTLLGESYAGSMATDRSKPTTIKLTVSFQPIRRGVELCIHTPSDHPKDRPPVQSLVKAIARARLWYEQLIAGEAGTLEQLGQQEGVTATYVKRILQCALLSPEITEAILAGRQARNFTLKKFFDELPMDWLGQAQVFRSATQQSVE